MRAGALTLGLMLMSSPARAADKQIRPWLGFTFGSSTTLVDLENGAAEKHVALGVNGIWLGDLVGIDVDVAHVPRFFESNNRLVLRSGVTTVTGNFVLALPRRLAEYSLRPYVVAGAGVMHASSTDAFGVLQVGDSLATFDFGGGATGFVTKRIGLSWELRRFQSMSREGPVVDFGPKKLSFWRANMGLAIRY